MLLIIGLMFLACQCSALYSTPDVIELTESNFNNLVINSEDIWVVEFFVPWCGHCQELVPEYEKAARALKGFVKVGAVDMDKYSTLGSPYGVRGFPTIKIFGANKNKPEHYKRQRTATDLVQEALGALSNKVFNALGTKPGSSGSKSSNKQDVIELTDDNFDKLVLQSDDAWLVEFFAPWCGHCKKLAPHWEQAATELKGKVKLGAIDITAHTAKASKYGIQGYPSIKFFPGGRKDADSVMDYDGGRTSSEIVNWSLEKVVENIPIPEIKQIVSEITIKEACDQKSLCIVAVLPHILDCQSVCRNEYLTVLKELGEKYKKKMWGWTWSEAGAQIELENSLDIGGFGYPAMAVVNAKKMKYSLLRGAFSKLGIDEFLRDLSYGRGNTAPVKGAQLPKVIKTDPWDGKDGNLPVEEEYLDLSYSDGEKKDADMYKHEL